MNQVYIEDKTFEKESYAISPFAKGEYENCRFIDCDFSNADLKDVKFLECEFSGCNLSLAKIDRTAFGNVKFRDCKLLGLLFTNCQEFGLSFQFDGCILDHSSFYKAKIKKTNFRNSKLTEVDFSDCDLSASIFDMCDLLNAKFENTILEKADFRTAYHYSIDPELNRIKKAKFSLEGIGGLLDKYDIEIEK